MFVGAKWFIAACIIAVIGTEQQDPNGTAAIVYYVMAACCAIAAFGITMITYLDNGLDGFKGTDE